MSCYEENLSSLRENRLYIYEKYMEADRKVENNRVEGIYTETAINGEPILMLRKGEATYRMNSTYNPSNEAKIWAEQFSLLHLNNVILMYGLGKGLHAAELAARLDKQDFLFIYEPSLQIFDHVMKEYDITPLLGKPNVILIVEDLNEFDFHNLLHYVTTISNFSTQEQCVHPFYDKLFRESYVKFWKEIKDTFIHTRININTEILFGQRIIINSLKNIRFIKNSNSLEDLTQDFDTSIPAIVVAAGPSVRQNIEELKRAKGKAYIFVVDRVLDYVLDNGLEPDFVVTLDPIKPVEFFSKRSDITIPLLCEIVSNWEVLDVHKGKKIIYECSPLYQKLYTSINKIPPTITAGASVATAAFGICVRMGFQKIVLVGQDLAYDGDVTHAGGVEEQYEDQDLMVEGVDGNKVRSRYDWYEFLVWFQDMIQLYPKLQVIDTKQSGAKIKGTEHMSLKDVVDRFCSKETGLDLILKGKKASFNEEEFTKVKKQLNSMEEDLKTLKKKAGEAIKLCDDQLREYQKKQANEERTYKNYKNLSKINKRLHENSAYSLLDSYITSMSASSLSKMYYFTDDMKSDQIATYEKSKKIYQSIVDGVEFSLPLLEEELDRLNLE